VRESIDDADKEESEDFGGLLTESDDDGKSVRVSVMTGISCYYYYKKG
jgi:hypothetical protein